MFLTLADVERVHLRLATEADTDLPSYDYTCLNNVNMCPTWGIIRYVHHKTFPTKGRAMALEAGTASHDCFAAVRLLDLFNQSEPHFHHHGVRIFGDDRWEEISNALEGQEDERTNQLNFVLTTLHTSGFYDDPRDKRRTLANIEESLIAYFDRWEWGKRPIWIADEDDPTALVGIEIPVNIVIEYQCKGDKVIALRYTGRMDGLHQLPRFDNRLEPQENKTGARMDETWLTAMSMTHQVTGYVVGASLVSGASIESAYVLGMAIPLPRSYDYGGIVTDRVMRHDHHKRSWLEWILHTVQIINQYKDQPTDAPMYSHSCNRFFRACAFVPLCYEEGEERKIIFDEMVEDEWDPLAN